jgi:hypothetical protein
LEERITTDGDSFEIIDLSDAFYREKGVPTPPARGGKFVVMRNEADDAEYLVLSPAAQSVYHTNVVERFCRLERFRIPGHFLKKGERFVIDDMDWKVGGGGKWDMDEEKKELRFHGSSQAYGTCLLVDLTNRVAGVPVMAGWRIVPY